MLGAEKILKVHILEILSHILFISKDRNDIEDIDCSADGGPWCPGMMISPLVTDTQLISDSFRRIMIDVGLPTLGKGEGVSNTILQ